MPLSVPSPSPLIVPPEATKTTQAVVFVCLSLAVFVLCCGLLSLVLWFYWRKSRREYEAYIRRRQGSEASVKQEGSVKKQVRLPVVVVNPDDNVEYGRKESRFFPSWQKPLADDEKEPKRAPTFPHTSPAGSYYIEGTPGYFEVDLEVGCEVGLQVGCPAKTPQQTPRAPTRSAKSAMDLLTAAISKLSPRVSTANSEPADISAGKANSAETSPKNNIGGGSQ